MKSQSCRLKHIIFIFKAKIELIPLILSEPIRNHHRLLGSCIMGKFGPVNIRHVIREK